MLDFDTWAEAVNKEFINRTGMDRDMWPDQDYYDMWEGGLTPVEAFAEAIENEYGLEGLATFGLEA